MIFWFFGQPGVGKDYIAKIFSYLSKIDYINGDTLLTNLEKQKIKTGKFTKIDRIKKLNRITKYLKSWKQDVIITDSLPDNNSRMFLLNKLGNKVKFILITTSKQKHINQIKSRKNHFFKAETLKLYIANNWEPINNFPHIKFKNSSDLQIKKQIFKLKNMFA